MPNHMDKVAAYNYLKEFMTEARDDQFNSVLSNRTRHIRVVMENLYTPHNASAVLRSCDCYGIQDIDIIENDHKWVVNEGVSMGAGKWLTVNTYNEEENNTRRCLQELKSKGYKIVATTPHTDDCTPETLSLEEPMAIVFGTELTGISNIVREEADEYLRIPMYGFTESFNISVAAALTLYEVSRRLRSSSIDWQLKPAEKQDLLFEWALKSIRESQKILDRFDPSAET